MNPFYFLKIFKMTATLITINSALSDINKMLNSDDENYINLKYTLLQTKYKKYLNKYIDKAINRKVHGCSTRLKANYYANIIKIYKYLIKKSLEEYIFSDILIIILSYL